MDICNCTSGHKSEKVIKKMEPLIEVVRIDEEKYVCRILLTYFEYMRINSKAKIKISIYRDKEEKVWEKTVLNYKILEPEFYMYNQVRNLENLSTVYTNMGVVKFRLRITLDSKLFITYFDNERIIAKKEYLGKDILQKPITWNKKINKNVNLSVMSNSRTNMHYQLVEKIFSFIVKKIDIIQNEKLINIYITDKISNLYDVIDNIDPNNSLNISIQNNIIICYHNIINLPFIITHEMTHALLYVRYGVKKENNSRLQILLLEGYCQYMANVFARKNDTKIRCYSGLKMLGINDKDEFIEVFFEPGYINEKYDLIIAYEIIPYFMLNWQGNILNDIISEYDDNVIKMKLIDIYLSMMNDDAMSNVYYNAIMNRYNNIFEKFFSKCTLDYYDGVYNLRRDIENLRYMDVNKIIFNNHNE